MTNKTESRIYWGEDLTDDDKRSILPILAATATETITNHESTQEEKRLHIGNLVIGATIFNSTIYSPDSRITSQPEDIRETVEFALVDAGCGKGTAKLVANVSTTRPRLAEVYNLSHMPTGTTEYGVENSSTGRTLNITRFVFGALGFEE